MPSASPLRAAHWQERLPVWGMWQPSKQCPQRSCAFPTCQAHMVQVPVRVDAVQHVAQVASQALAQVLWQAICHTCRSLYDVRGTCAPQGHIFHSLVTDAPDASQATCTICYLCSPAHWCPECRKPSRRPPPRYSHDDDGEDIRPSKLFRHSSPPAHLQPT